MQVFYFDMKVRWYVSVADHGSGTLSKTSVIGLWSVNSVESLPSQKY